MNYDKHELTRIVHTKNERLKHNMLLRGLHETPRL